MRNIKVLVVDDSALMRQILSDVFDHVPDVQVIGTATDPYSAWDKIHRLSPDVITLDVEMPRMDGLAFLERLMVARPLPVVMVSSLTETGCDTTLRALELGAVDVIPKPKLDIVSSFASIAEELVAKVRAAANAKVRRRIAPRSNAIGPSLVASIPPIKFRTTHQVITIGASTGGTEALASVLSMLPADAPGIVAVIHMPAGFTHSYANRLDRICALRVHEASDGDRVLPGHVLIAPGNLQTAIRRSGAITTVCVFPGEAVNRHRPSVDVLFASCAEHLGPNAVGAILTGMGDDGARGMLAMKRAGASTIAQNEDTSVVFGMPREAIALGAVDEVLPLDRIPQALIRLAAIA